MPDESCRTCGGELGNHAVCPGCRKSTQKKCKMCDHVTLLQSHPHCVKNASPPQKPLLVPVVQRKASKNRLHFSFLAVAVVGFFILGLAAASYHEIPQVVPDEAQATNSSDIT